MVIQADSAGEAAMFETLELMRTALHALEPEESFGFVLFRDGASVRGFAGCTMAKVEYDLSEAALFGYSLVVNVDEVDLRDGPLV